MKLDEFLKKAKALLEKEAILDYKNEIEIIFSTVLNKDRLSLYLDYDEEISREETKEIIDIIKRRVDNREPLQYILGKTFFYSYPFKVTKDVLIPRKETEIMVEHVIKLCKNFENPKVLDIGTGSGAIAITIAKLVPGAIVTALDISEQALNIAKINSEINQVKVNFLKSDLFSNVNDKFDIIVSNPPYISIEDFYYLEPEVKDYEPKIALIAPNNPLHFYKLITEQAINFSNRGSYLVFEIDPNIKRGVVETLSTNYKIIKIIKDYNMNDRIIISKMKG